MAEESPSKTQLDKLGDRLRAGTKNEADLRALDDYRRSFRRAYDVVAGTIREILKLDGTGRPAKTTAAIIDKLRRQPIRLTQIQDIAGFRVIVADASEQDRVIKVLMAVFREIDIDDRTEDSSHGYRAIHAIVSTEGRLVEIQVRTLVQHLWAELSEKLSDVIDPAIKYGGGPEATRERLLAYSELLGRIEKLERGDARGARMLHLRESELRRIARSDAGFDELKAGVEEMTRLQHEGEESTQDLKRALADLLTAYYNDPVDPRP